MSRLLECLATVDESAAAFLAGKTLDTRGLLAAVFSLNNEIGILLRRSGDPALKALQLKVNELTVAAKSTDGDRIRSALEDLMKAVPALRVAYGGP